MEMRTDTAEGVVRDITFNRGRIEIFLVLKVPRQCPLPSTRGTFEGGQSFGE
jgi:hypothetical protein